MGQTRSQKGQVQMVQIRGLILNLHNYRAGVNSTRVQLSICAPTPLDFDPVRDENLHILDTVSKSFTTQVVIR